MTKFKGATNKTHYAELWDMCNKLLNILRTHKGTPLVSRNKNPYKNCSIKYK